MHGRFAALALSLVFVAAPAAGASPSLAAAGAKMAALYASCKAFNAKYPHGVGRNKSQRLQQRRRPSDHLQAEHEDFDLAMSHNKGLDHDKDGVACEKA